MRGVSESPMALPDAFPKPYSRYLGESNLVPPAGARGISSGISSSPLRLASSWQDSPHESCHKGSGRSSRRYMKARADIGWGSSRVEGNVAVLMDLRGV